MPGVLQAQGDLGLRRGEGAWFKNLVGGAPHPPQQRVEERRDLFVEAAALQRERERVGVEHRRDRVVEAGDGRRVEVLGDGVRDEGTYELQRGRIRHSGRRRPREPRPDVERGKLEALGPRKDPDVPDFQGSRVRGVGRGREALDEF